jgi:predicted amidohydrolase YtcJ
VAGGKIAAVGKRAADCPAASEAARVIDAGDRLVMAGFHDSHTHLIMAGLYASYPNLSGCRSERETAAAVRAFADSDSEHETEWVYGFGWYHVYWDNLTLPTKETLDAFFPVRPVLLVNAEAHGAWVNSATLRIAGITRSTPDPAGGRIERDADGEPTGVLTENAIGLVTKYAFRFETKAEHALIKNYLKRAAAFGITSVNDMRPYFHGDMGNLALYSELDGAGELTARIHAATDLRGNLDEALRLRALYNSDRLRVDMVKCFLDGVSTTHTALLLADYSDMPGFRGAGLHDPAVVESMVIEAQRRGLSVRLHACGDGSCRVALDAFGAAERQLGRNGKCRHAIEHCELVSESDIARFGTLGVIPSVQPEHLAVTEKFAGNPYCVTLGERADRTWPFRSLLASAGVLAFGSDCPVVDCDPFSEIHRAITRVFNDGLPAGGWNPAQKLTLFDALRAYTYGSAYGVGREEELGTLEAGKFADLIVLDRNLFEASPEDIRRARVDVTVMGGAVVYERPGTGSDSRP